MRSPWATVLTACFLVFLVHQSTEHIHRSVPFQITYRHTGQGGWSHCCPSRQLLGLLLQLKCQLSPVAWLAWGWLSLGSAQGMGATVPQACLGASQPHAGNLTLEEEGPEHQHLNSCPAFSPGQAQKAFVPSCSVGTSLLSYHASSLLRGS